MNEVVFANIRASDTYFNHGDEASSPFHYLSWPGASHTCITKLDPDDARPLILGGGGLFMRNYADRIGELATKRKVIIWGAGLNYARGPVPPELARSLGLCYRIGVRDRVYASNYGFQYVPCASCLHPAFKSLQRWEPTNDVVVYHHNWEHEPEFVQDYSARYNMDRTHSLLGIFEFLASARVVVTSSYHGAYWAMLLGRRVILYGAEAMRFYTGLPYLPPIARDQQDFSQLVDKQNSIFLWDKRSDIYRDAVDINQQFAAQVRQDLGISL